jgi:hypothetical protein
MLKINLIYNSGEERSILGALVSVLCDIELCPASIFLISEEKNVARGNIW